MTQEDRALFNLVQFDRDFLRPVADHFSSTKSTYWRTLRFCEMASAYFWLDLGIQVGYFPLQESASVVGQRFVPFFGRFNEDFKDYGYLFDPSFAGIINQALRNPFAHQLRMDTIGSNIATLSVFSSALCAEISLARNQSGENLVGVLNFAPKMLEDVIVRDHALQTGTEPFFDRLAVTRGFAAVVEYMESLIRLSRSVFGDAYIAEPDRVGLERGIRQVTRWRVNRFRTGSEKDFFTLGRYVTDQADLDFAVVLPKLRTLLENWGFTHVKTVSA